MRSLVVSLALFATLAGCATRRRIAIKTHPPDAKILVDGVEIGRGSEEHTFIFNGPASVHTVGAQRFGFKEKHVTVTRDSVGPNIELNLARQSRRVAFSVSPVPAIVRVDGQALMSEPTISASSEIEFALDADEQFKTHVVTAEREGFEKAEAVISFSDPQPVYALRLEPKRKDLTITSTPAGATVFLDGESLGPAPARRAKEAFPFDVESGTYATRRVRVEKPGFPAVEQNISWDDGQTAYDIALVPQTKNVTVKFEPADVRVSIDGGPAFTPKDGVFTEQFVFPPTDEAGTPKTYTFDVTPPDSSKAPADAAQHFPTRFTLAWDGGKNDYTVALREILTRVVPTAEVRFDRRGETWRPDMTPGTARAVRSISEPDDAVQPRRVAVAPPGGTIGSLALSPDGSRLVYSVITGKDTATLRGQLYMVRTDGTGAATALSDNRSLDLMPTFTPAGDAIVFSSNRAGRRMNLFSISADGSGGVRQLTQGDTSDLWPSVDAEAKPRLFYQALIDTRDDARLFSTEIGSVFRTDLTPNGGTQPRVSPKNDSVVFALADESTGRADLFRTSDRGGPAENLTNSPDVDDRDPAWNVNGSRVIFASDRDSRTAAAAAPTTRPDEEQLPTGNFDLYVLDVARPANVIRLTHNLAVDDRPVWDPSGDAVYFRSNRGGQWGVWKITVK